MVNTQSNLILKQVDIQTYKGDIKMIYIDNKELSVGYFPNNEMYIEYNKLCFNNESKIKFKCENDNDIFILYMLKKYIDEILPNNELNLEILYMPYSRMDRYNGYYIFTLKYLTDMINKMNWYRVITYDIHSDISNALLDRSINYSNLGWLFSQKIRPTLDNKDFVICFPDAGAQKRYNQMFQYPCVIGMKERDFNTGNITKFKIDMNGVESIKGKTVVIIDDICSKGGTFVATAQALKNLGAQEVILLVSHCEETIFKGDLLICNDIDMVYTTNSIINNNRGDEKLNITKLI